MKIKELIKRFIKMFIKKEVNTDRLKLDKKEDCGSCDLCMKVCEKMGIGAITTVGRNTFKEISMKHDDPSQDCIGCAICVGICPKNVIKMTDKDGEREIWGKKFKLVKCEDCGKYYATEEHVKYAYNRAGIRTDKLRCGECKRKSSMENIKKYI